jgi:hydroxyacylglutathione hydrolase
MPGEKSILRAGGGLPTFAAVKPAATLPLEDEIGDVLEKGMQQAGVAKHELAEQAGVPVARIGDALDYRSELTCEELQRIAGVLRLNEVGLCALGLGRYPLPAIGALPFCVWPLAMPHGIGVANAYLVAETGASRGLLFDTGAGIEALETSWPAAIKRVEAVFLTHVEAEHAGGLCDVVERYGVQHAFVPMATKAPCGKGVGEGAVFSFGEIEVMAFATPGHVDAHNCYHVRKSRVDRAPGLLISGDLVFAGSAGGARFSPRQLKLHLQRMLASLPANTVIAPGHGPLTTVENELRYNPFAT